jgi:hypothetical protein
MVVLFIISAYSSNLKAQQTDSSAQNQQPPVTVEPKIKIPINHPPKRAALMSTILPGAGQIYNKKYWKVPLIYVGAAGLAYSFNVNQTKYSQYRKAYIARLDGDPNTIDNYPKYTDDNLNTLQKFYQRNRNLTVIGASLLYVMNIIDASVDAHMFTFSVDDDDLSFQVRPTVINMGYMAANPYVTGVSLSLNFK